MKNPVLKALKNGDLKLTVLASQGMPHGTFQAAAAV